MSVMILSIISNAANSLIETHTDGQTEICFSLNKMTIDHNPVILKSLAEEK